MARITVLIGALTLSPHLQVRGADIAFAPEFGGDALYVMNTENRSVIKKSLGLGRIQELAYSHVRRTIAFVGSRTEEDPAHLFLLSWPGEKLRRVPDAPNRAHPYRPQFDPDGENIYAVNYGPVIFRYSLEKQDWRPVAVEGVADLHVQGVAFSPSGRLVTISPGHFKGFLIASVDKDHFKVIRSILADFDSCISAHWIDESHIVFLGRKTPGLQFLWSFDMQTGQTQQLTHQPLGTRDFLSLSNDGRGVVFTATDSVRPDWTVWSLSLDSDTPVKLLPGQKDNSYLFPTWLD